MKIFIVEDETEICKELSVLLQKYGYSFESSTDFAHITGRILEAEPDLILLKTVGHSDYCFDKQKHRF